MTSTAAAGETTFFNVIVPTRERADTLRHCLRTLCGQDYPYLRIVVSDNKSRDGTRSVVESFDDARIHYVNTGARISMTANWEFGLNHAERGWVMFLGDDDGLCPGALRRLDAAIREHDVEAVSCAQMNFQWPGHFDSASSGSLSIPISRSMSVRRSEKSARRVFDGEMHYSELPWLYHGGAAKLELLDRLRDAEGRFFRSQVPDLYSAVALSLGTDRFLSIRVPLAVNGASRHSTGTSHMSTDPAAESAAKLFAAENSIPFHESLILGRSLQIVLYECYLQSWHIHRGKPGIELADQLQVAMQVATAELAAETKRDCVAIARMNNIAFDPTPSASRRNWWRRMAGLKRAYGTVILEPAALGTRDIFAAAAAAWAVYDVLSRHFLARHACLASGFASRIAARLARCRATPRVTTRSAAEPSP